MVFFAAGDEGFTASRRAEVKLLGEVKVGSEGGKGSGQTNIF